jgi:hypothetical protein
LTSLRESAGAAIKLGVVLLALTWTVATGQESSRITEYGIYSKEGNLQSETHEIRIAPQTRFGFCFEVRVQSSDESLVLVETLNHPIVVRDGIENSGYSMPRMFAIKQGKAVGCSGYVAARESDLAAGIWKFTLSDGAVDLVVQEFHVTQ